MDAKVCNKCKKMFGEDGNNRGTISGFWNEDIELDLCDDCKDLLDDFISTKPRKSKGLGK